MPTPFASASDLAAGWKPLDADQLAVADVLLERASAMLRARDPGIDGRILAGTLDPTLPLVVVTDMVRAAVSGPDPGVQSETTGPFTVRWSTAAATGRLVLTAEQLASLQPAGLSTGRPRWLGQIGVRRGPL